MRPVEELGAGVGGGRLDGQAHQRRRPARAGRAVVADRGRVALDQADPLEPTPISAAAIWASTVDEPWPISVLPHMTVTDPSAQDPQDRGRDRLRPGVRGGEGDRLAAAGDRRGRPSRAPRPRRLRSASRSASIPRTRGHGRSPERQDVPAAKLERIETQPLGRLVHLRFGGEGDLRRPEAAERAGRRGVRVDDVAGHVERRDPVRARRAGWRPCGRRAASSPRSHRCPAWIVARRPRRWPSRSKAVAIRTVGRVAARGQDRLLDAQRQPDRSPGPQGEGGRQRLDLRVGLAAVAAADVRER